MDFAKRLRLLRKESNLTQEEFAKKINKNRSTIAGYETERKQPEYDTLVDVAKAFDVSVDYLLGETSTRKWDHEIPATHMVSVDGLDENEIAQIKGMIELLKKKHGQAL